MPKKTIIIFITTFIIVGILLLSVYSWLNKKETPVAEDTTPWYQDFNPFGGGGNTTTDNNNNPNEEPANTDEQPQVESYGFHKLTDFAIAGATFKKEMRAISGDSTTVAPQIIKVQIDAKTKDGRKEIQIFLNTALNLNPPLVVDGNFGKKATQAIKDFQKLNNVPQTGIIDDKTAPLFTKNQEPTTAQKSLFEEVPAIRYVEKINGHIYKKFLDTKIEDKISNSTIPSIYEAAFNDKADTVVYRYLSSNKLISTFIATLGAPKGEFLAQNISEFSVSKDKTKFFFLTENDNGSVGTIGTFGQAKRDIVLNSPYTEWLSDWDNSGNLYLTTKPSYTVTGSMFSLNSASKTMTKILGGVNGLTTKISGNGSFVLFNTTTDTGPKLSIYDISKHSTKELETYGLPEKCTWSTDNLNIYCAVPSTITGNQYPDSWYQGLVSFDDYFVKINTATGDKVTIANSPKDSTVDAVNLFMDDKESSIFFTNKKDSTLWSLDIK